MNFDKVGYATFNFVLNINHKNLEKSNHEKLEKFTQVSGKISICVFCS